MDTISNTIVAVSVIAGALITIFTLFAVMVRGMKWLAALPQEIKNYLYKPRYILIPTPDEIAIYSVKEPASLNRMSISEYYEERDGYSVRRYNRWRREAGFRTIIVMLFVALIYVSFLLRLFHYAIVDDVDGSTIAYSVILTLSATLSLVSYFAVAALSRDLRSTIVRRFWY